MSSDFQLIDSHCHLHFDDYLQDVSTVIHKAKSEKVAKIVCVGCSLADSENAIEFVRNREGLWATAGAHPHDGANFMENPNANKMLKNLLSQPKVVAVGEIGLDYFHEYTSKEKQEEVLRNQIEIGLETDLPFVFHVREAFADFWAIIDSYQKVKGVIHSFSAHPQELEQVLSRDFYVGLNGIMTFTKDALQLEAAKLVPLDRLLLETDAPFLAPKPFRGKRCEPKHVKATAEFLAELRGESLVELASNATKNTERLFGI